MLPSVYRADYLQVPCALTHDYRTKVTDRRIVARSLVSDETFSMLLVGDLVDIDFGPKPLCQGAQKGLIADNSLLGWMRKVSVRAYVQNSQAGAMQPSQGVLRDAC